MKSSIIIVGKNISEDFQIIKKLKPFVEIKTYSDSKKILLEKKDNFPDVILLELSSEKEVDFSLLELLVALFVVVIIPSLVTLAVNSGSADVEVEARAKSLVDI